jgi:glyoxylase-like metal-dependent hydrolase (beta-lactamase superfamily II)
VAVDGTLTVSGGRAMRDQVTRTGKPLVGVLVTHAHPDHYGGIAELVAGDDVDVWSILAFAQQGVEPVARSLGLIRRDRIWNPARHAQ